MTDDTTSYETHMRERLKLICERLPGTMANSGLSYVIEDALELARVAGSLLELERSKLQIDLECRVQRLEDHATPRREESVWTEHEKNGPRCTCPDDEWHDRKGQ